jgi:hypothetical protein
MSLNVTLETAEDVDTQAIKPIPAANAAAPMVRFAVRESVCF